VPPSEGCCLTPAAPHPHKGHPESLRPQGVNFASAKLTPGLQAAGAIAESRLLRRQSPPPRTLAKLATGRTPSRFVSTPPRPIHRWKAPGETVTTVILHGGVLYYNLSYGGYTPKSQLAAINPLFLPETLIYLDIVFIMYDLVPFGRRQRSEVRLQQRSASPN
jgi:hypothetical protein